VLEVAGGKILRSPYLHSHRECELVLLFYLGMNLLFINEFEGNFDLKCSVSNICFKMALLTRSFNSVIISSVNYNIYFCLFCKN